jgi:hypothetical protein
MNIKPRLVAALMRIYPAAWRSEYGAELTDMLLACPLDAGTIADVLWNGFRQRARAAEPSTICGLATMLAILAAFAWEVAVPAPRGHTLNLLLQDSSKTLPTIDVRPLTSQWYFVFLMACGCWTHLRHGGGALLRSSGAGMRLTMIASIPIILVGILISAGILGVIVLEPGDMRDPAMAHEQGFTFLSYSAHGRALSVWTILLSLILRLPESWMWGLYGGLLGRWISSARRSPVPSS